MTQPIIKMYVRPGCPDVEYARQVLRARDLNWDEIDIEDDPEAKERVMGWNHGHAITPTLFIGDTMLSEPDEAEIDGALAQEMH